MTASTSNERKPELLGYGCQVVESKVVFGSEEHSREALVGLHLFPLWEEDAPSYLPESDRIPCAAKPYLARG